MTEIAIPSISIQIGTRKSETIKLWISSNQFEEDMKALINILFQKMGLLTLEEFDKELHREKYKEGKEKRIEARTYRLQVGSIRFAQRAIQIPDRRICKPLDELLGFKNSRQSQRAKEKICMLAADKAYRSAVIHKTYRTGRPISPSTIR